MSNFKISKTLYLPSAGISYSPFVKCFPITNKSQIFSIDPHLINSTVEYVIGLISQYCVLETEVEELYTQDAYYLWLYFLSTDLLSKWFGIYIADSICKKCNEKNKVSVDISKLIIKIYNKYKNDFMQEFAYSLDNFAFIFHHRKVKNNIEFANIIIDFEEHSPTTIAYSKIYHILTQTKIIKYHNEEVNKNEWFHLMTSLGTQTINSIFDYLEEQRFMFGPDLRMYYKCRKCGTTNRILIVDDFFGSYMSSNTNKNLLLEQEEFFEAMINTARLPTFTITDFLDMPIRYTSAISNVMSRIKFMPTSIL